MCHQRRIRDDQARLAPRAAGTSLAGYSVETISADEATPLIHRYEWLGTLGQSYIFIGLRSPSRELHGVSCFGPGPAGDISGLLGGPALCLERGACVHFAPFNAASFLTNEACRLAYRHTGIARFYAYADPMAGEYGGIYQAAGWLYLGRGLNGGAGRARRHFILRPGDDPDDPASWRSTRELRRNGTRMTFQQARDRGWQIASREAKHVYATCVGRDRKAWRKQIIGKLYPAPRPELKRGHSGQFRPPAGLGMASSIVPCAGETAGADKVLENKLRRMAERQRLRLVKSKRRDRLAHDFGWYRLLDLTGREVHQAASMDAVLQYLLSP